MARKRVEEPVKSLDELIPSYGEHKAAYDDLKKIVDAENADIKKLMKNKAGTKTAGGYTISITVADIESVDEEKMCEKLTDFPEAHQYGIIKTKEYVDTAALETAVYKGLLPKKALEAIDSCRSSKPRVTLKVAKAKEE